MNTANGSAVTSPLSNGSASLGCIVKRFLTEPRLCVGAGRHISSVTDEKHSDRLYQSAEVLTRGGNSQIGGSMIQRKRVGAPT
jgi:hypothetical protein